MEDRRHWYEAEVLMADLTGHRHTMRGARVGEIEARMRLIYPQALTLLVRPENDETPSPSGSHAGTAPDYLLVASFPPSPSFYRA
jgi:hypothetical protein